MEQTTITITPIAGTEGLTVRTLRILQVIARELGERTDSVDYDAIARELNTKWNNVKYAVGALVKAGILTRSDGRLTVLKRIVA